MKRLSLGLCQLVIVGCKKDKAVTPDVCGQAKSCSTSGECDLGDVCEQNCCVHFSGAVRNFNRWLRAAGQWPITLFVNYVALGRIYARGRTAARQRATQLSRFGARPPPHFQQKLAKLSSARREAVARRPRAAFGTRLCRYLPLAAPRARAVYAVESTLQGAQA